MSHLLERQVELQMLGGAIERASTGRGSAVLVLGEAGIGKTSLVHAFLSAAAERARRELLSTGETVRKRGVEPARTRPVQAIDALTAQETQVARLALDGLSNSEIGVRLFISSRTVQYHLRKVFTKFGISSRGQLHRAMGGDPATVGLS